MFRRILPENRPAESIRAAFFLEPMPRTAPLIAAWTQAGHEVAAIVLPQRHNALLAWHLTRLIEAPQWSLPGTLARHAPRAPVLRLSHRPRWGELASRLAELGADVLISAFFPRRIPETVLSVFRHGGFNLHPSLLPHFRGPSPLQHLLLTDAWREHGGVTLHRMTAGLDEGDIIAFAPLAEERWRDRDALDPALAGAMASLTANAVPAWCRGETGAKPQPAGDFGWAGEMADFTVASSWTAAHLRRVLAFFGHKPGVWLPLGDKKMRLGSILTVLGPPIGKPPRNSGRSVEFDLSDARVSCRNPSWMMQSASGLHAWLARRRQRPPHVPFMLADPR